MSRRDFELIAETIRQSDEIIDLTTEQRDKLARWFAKTLAATNPQFDRARFLKAAGVQ